MFFSFYFFSKKQIYIFVPCNCGTNCVSFLCEKMFLRSMFQSITGSFIVVMSCHFTVDGRWSIYPSDKSHPLLFVVFIYKRLSIKYWSPLIICELALWMKDSFFKYKSVERYIFLYTWLTPSSLGREGAQLNCQMWFIR